MDMKLSPYSQQWKNLYEKEAVRIKDILGDLAIDIQHIGSTAIPRMIAKPIIDIAAALSSLDNAKDLIKPLTTLGYNYDESVSSSERYFFRKGEPTQYHLSLTAPNVSFWRRQILFRDYLISHPSAAKEYQELKVKMIEIDPTGRGDYINAKDPFIKKILKLAEK